MKAHRFFFIFPLLLPMILLQAQDFRESFFEGGWLDHIGYKGYEFASDTFNVMDYGSYADGIRKTTAQLQQTIDACSAAGGGVVYFPEGKYHTGSLFLGSNMELHMDREAVILGSMDIRDYPEQFGRAAGIETWWPMGIINAREVKNVKISGEGLINGRGKPFWDTFWNMVPEYEENNLRWAVDYDCKRPRMLFVDGCENVRIEDITLRESGFWTIHVLYSKSVTIDGIIIRNNIEGAHGPSTDGIDIDSSEDILVENCDIDCNDDNFCVKAGRDADGLRVNRPSQFIEFRNNLARGGHGLITFGSDLSGGINHVYVHDMKADGNLRGIRIKSARTRGGVVEQILIENVEIRNSELVFEFNLNWFPEFSYPELPLGFNKDSIPHHWTVLLQKVELPANEMTSLNYVMSYKNEPDSYLFRKMSRLFKGREPRDGSR